MCILKTYNCPMNHHLMRLNKDKDFMLKKLIEKKISICLKWTYRRTDRWTCLKLSFAFRD